MMEFKLGTALSLLFLQIVEICASFDQKEFSIYSVQSEAHFLSVPSNGKSITVDDSKGLGRLFEGVGAISGGGVSIKGINCSYRPNSLEA